MTAPAELLTWDEDQRELVTTFALWYLSPRTLGGMLSVDPEIIGRRPGVGPRYRVALADLKVRKLELTGDAGCPEDVLPLDLRLELARLGRMPMATEAETDQIWTLAAAARALLDRFQRVREAAGRIRLNLSFLDQDEQRLLRKLRRRHPFGVTEPVGLLDFDPVAIIGMVGPGDRSTRQFRELSPSGREGLLSRGGGVHDHGSAASQRDLSTVLDGVEETLREYRCPVEVSVLKERLDPTLRLPFPAISILPTIRVTPIL